MNTQKITPFLWFNDQAEKAANSYISVFKNSRIVNIALYGEARVERTLLSAAFHLDLGF